MGSRTTAWYELYELEMALALRAKAVPLEVGARTNGIKRPRDGSGREPWVEPSRVPALA